MSTSLTELGICEISKKIASGELSPVTLVGTYLDRIAQVDPKVNSFITVTGDLAMAQAKTAQRELESGRSRGPLHGVPLSLKDMIDVAGVPTTAHSRILRDNVPSRSAAVVERLNEAGAVLLGKNATHEFAHGGPSFDLPWPPARNPWKLDHHPGGSSSGSAAALAAGLTAGSLGTDTGGSIRSPSYLCGTIGLKPTFGRVSRRGVVPFSASCDHVGPMTRSVADCALLLQAISGHDPEDAASADIPVPDYSGLLGHSIAGIRIGVPRHFWEEDVAVPREVSRAIEEAIATLRGLGAVIENIRLRRLQEYYASRIIITESELLNRHLPTLRSRSQDYGEHFLGRILPAIFFSAADYVAAQRQRRLCIEEMTEVYQKYDLVLIAGTGPAQPLKQSHSIGVSQKWLVPNLNSLFSLTGAPALALPCGFTDNGLPLGLQLGGRPFEEVILLQVGHAYEQATRWSDRRPDLDGQVPMQIVSETTHRQAGQNIDSDIRARAQHILDTLDLKLSEAHFYLLAEGAAHALEFSRWARGRVECAPWGGQVGSQD